MFDKILQVTGAAWYLLAVERYDTCWREACIESKKCTINYLYCGISENVPGYKEWSDIRVDVLNKSCAAEGDNPPFHFGIFTEAISSKVIASTEFFSKFLFCLWWGLKNLRYDTHVSIFFLNNYLWDMYTIADVLIPRKKWIITPFFLFIMFFPCWDFFNFIFPLQASLLLLPVVMIPQTTDESPYGLVTSPVPHLYAYLTKIRNISEEES